MRIYIFEAEREREREREKKKEFNAIDTGHEIVISRLPLKVENPIDCYDADIISTFIRSELSEETLKNFLNLKLIATRSTGNIRSNRAAISYAQCYHYYAQRI